MTLWEKILDFTLNALASIGSFANWLFTPLRFSDLLINAVEVTGTNIFGNTRVQTIVEVLRNFFNQDSWSWTNDLYFAPIHLITISGLIVVVIMGVIKTFDIFA